MFNIRDQIARRDFEEISKEFYEYRRLANEFKIGKVLPLQNRVSTIESGMNASMRSLEKRVSEQATIIKCLLDHLNLEVKYTPPDKHEHYKIVEKEVEEEVTKEMIDKIIAEAKYKDEH